MSTLVFVHVHIIRGSSQLTISEYPLYESKNHVILEHSPNSQFSFTALHGGGSHYRVMRSMINRDETALLKHPQNCEYSILDPLSSTDVAQISILAPFLNSSS